jgi:hypothetical protein
LLIVHPVKVPVSNPGLVINCVDVGATVKLVAGVPLNDTAEAVVQFLPEIVTVVPETPLGGSIDITVGSPVTVKPMIEGDVPIGVVTLKFRSPTAAPAATEIVIGKVVAVPPLPIDAVTPVPLNVTAVALVRLAPVIVALNVVPAIDELGVIDMIDIAGPTVKPLNGADIAADVVTENACNPVVAFLAIEMPIGRVVAVPPLPIVAVTPVPLNVTEVAPVRPVPVIVALSVALCAPWLGEIPAIVIGFAVTVKPLYGDDVPTGVVTVIVRNPSVDWGSIVIVRGKLVAVPPLPIAAATPDPLNVTADAPVRSVPVIV